MTSEHEALLFAAIGCPHAINDKTLTLHFDPKQEGHNALNQLSLRLSAALAGSAVTANSFNAEFLKDAELARAEVASWPASVQEAAAKTSVLQSVHPVGAVLPAPDAPVGGLESVPRDGGLATALDITLDQDAADLLRQTIGDEDEAEPIRLLYGDGHSGWGLYVAQAEYQDQGASLLAAAPKAQPSQAPVDLRSLLKTAANWIDDAVGYTGNTRWTSLTEKGEALMRQIDAALASQAQAPQATNVADAALRSLGMECTSETHTTDAIGRTVTKKQWSHLVRWEGGADALPDGEHKLFAQPAAPQAQMRHTVYAWLGRWRDEMPARAVTALQDALGPLDEAAPQAQAGKVFCCYGMYADVGHDANCPAKPGLRVAPQAQARESLPAFIRRDVEQAIAEAINPKGMSVHDGKARIGVDRLQYMLRFIDGISTDKPTGGA